MPKVTTPATRSSISGISSDTFVSGDWANLGFSSVGVVRKTNAGVLQWSLDTNGDDAFDGGDAIDNYGINAAWV